MARVTILLSPETANGFHIKPAPPPVTGASRMSGFRVAHICLVPKGFKVILDLGELSSCASPMFSLNLHTLVFLEQFLKDGLLLFH